MSNDQEAKIYYLAIKSHNQHDDTYKTCKVFIYNLFLVADVQLDIHMGPKQLEQRLSLNQPLDLLLLTGLPSWALDLL